MTNFHTLEVVGRGSKTQLQVGGKLVKIQQLKGYFSSYMVRMYVCFQNSFETHATEIVKNGFLSQPFKSRSRLC